MMMMTGVQAEDCIQPACFTKDLTVVIQSRDSRFNPSMYVFLPFQCIISVNFLYTDRSQNADYVDRISVCVCVMVNVNVC